MNPQSQRTPTLKKSASHYVDLSDKVVMITGARGGIGSAAVNAFAEQGARVIGLDIDAVNPDGEGVDQRTTDVSDPTQVAAAVAAVVEDYGSLDVWVNNAGIMDRMSAFDLDLESWNRTLSVNLTATFFGAQAAGRIMAQNGGGSIINMSSYAGITARPNCADYAASKAAVAHLTECLAMEWGPLGIRVNAIAPGYIKTPMSSWMHENAANYETYIGKTPLRRLGEPAEIGQLMLYLASDASSYITGQSILADGGIAHA